MTKLFTAVGVVNVSYSTNSEDASVNFSHVVQASTKDEAEEKVLDYYIDKSSPFTTYRVRVIEIFDFIS